MLSGSGAPFETLEALHDVEERRDRPAQRLELAAEIVELRGRLAAAVAVEDVGLDEVELLLERLDDGEVLVDHEVEQGVEHVARAERQEVALGFAAAAQADVRFWSEPWRTVTT